MLAKPLNLQDQDQQSLVMQVLKLVLSCLNFDFLGSSADESADDLCTVQIPTTWRTSKKREGRVNIVSVQGAELTQRMLECCFILSGLIQNSY